jgi:hypothetical protein
MDVGDLNNFLRSRNAATPCPVCHHQGCDGWAVLEGGSNFNLATDSAPPGLVKAIPLVCRNCGFIRLHAFDAMTYKWRGWEGLDEERISGGDETLPPSET